jgi:hypothetical protein
MMTGISYSCTLPYPSDARLQKIVFVPQNVLKNMSPFPDNLEDSLHVNVPLAPVIKSRSSKISFLKK